MSAWIKYAGIAAAFAGVGMRVFSWLQQAKAPGSPGGDHITAEEIAKLEPVIQDAINQGLQSADVPIIAEVKLTYIG
jgi:hypothetical protein